MESDAPTIRIRTGTESVLGGLAPSRSLNRENCGGHGPSTRVDAVALVSSQVLFYALDAHWPQVSWVLSMMGF